MAILQEQDKLQIARAVRSRMSDSGLGLKRAALLSGLSSTNLSFIRSEKEEWKERTISDEIWKRAASWAGLDLGGNGWVGVATPNFKRLHNICTFARENKLAVGVVGNAGYGKSFAAKAYRDAYPNTTFYIQVANYWTKRDFVMHLKDALGIDKNGKSISEQVHDIIRALQQRQGLLLIIDEADKVKDAALDFIKAIYDEAISHCGVVLLGTPYLRDRIERGAERNRLGYAEFYSRLGSNFQEMRGIGEMSVKELCAANGITQKYDQDEIWRQVKNEGDYRQVNQLVRVLKLRKEKAAADTARLKVRAGV